MFVSMFVGQRSLAFCPWSRHVQRHFGEHSVFTCQIACGSEVQPWLLSKILRRHGLINGQVSVAQISLIFFGKHHHHMMPRPRMSQHVWRHCHCHYHNVQLMLETHHEPVFDFALKCCHPPLMVQKMHRSCQRKAMRSRADRRRVERPSVVGG